MGHYSIGQVTSIEDLHTSFGVDPRPNTLNYVLGSTSGVHGSYASLDDIEACFERTCDCEGGDHEYDEEGRADFTVLLVRPRLVHLSYGHIEITRGDIPYLRLLITRSMEAIRESQAGNLIG
ncbi:MAG TPA: hypothetical protein VMT30_09485 [Candidatus Saccharimonadia bacterium]|nr:hypothetical protein [Candidatus Saccharimonadia bacterium]